MTDIDSRINDRISISIEGDVGIITSNHPPVNALSHILREQLDVFAADTPSDPSLKPAGLLRELAEQNSSFAAWQKSGKPA